MKDIQIMPEEFYDRFQSLMEEQSIKPKTLCRKMNVSTNTVYEWLEGRVMTTVNFMRICQFFNVNPSWLYGITDERTGYASD